MFEHVPQQMKDALKLYSTSVHAALMNNEHAQRAETILAHIRASTGYAALLSASTIDHDFFGMGSLDKMALFFVTLPDRFFACLPQHWRNLLAELRQIQDPHSELRTEVQAMRTQLTALCDFCRASQCACRQ